MAKEVGKRITDISENPERVIIRRLNKHRDGDMDIEKDVMKAWNHWNKEGVKKEWIYVKIASESGLEKYQVEYIIKKHREG